MSADKNEHNKSGNENFMVDQPSKGLSDQLWQSKIKMLQAQDPLRGLRESIKVLQAQDPLRGLRESIKVLQAQDPLRGLRESIKVLQAQDPLRGLRESIKVLQSDELRALRSRFNEYAR